MARGRKRLIAGSTLLAVAGVMAAGVVASRWIVFEWKGGWGDLGLAAGLLGYTSPDWQSDLPAGLTARVRRPPDLFWVYGDPSPPSITPPTWLWTSHLFGFIWKADDSLIIDVVAWPLPVVAVGLGLVLLYAGRRAGTSAGLCPSCGYDLSATPNVQKCPECGAVRGGEAASSAGGAGVGVGAAATGVGGPSTAAGGGETAPVQP